MAVPYPVLAAELSSDEILAYDNLSDRERELISLSDVSLVDRLIEGISRVEDSSNSTELWFALDEALERWAPSAAWEHARIYSNPDFEQADREIELRASRSAIALRAYGRALIRSVHGDA